MTVRVRFAPSPTGELHEGGAMVAVANDLLRRRDGGELMLRIDDTDAERALEGSEDRIAADLAWLGIAVSETVRQSDRADRHCAAAQRLVADGLAAEGADGAIILPAASSDVVVQDLSRGAIRIPAEEVGPTVLVRADGRPTFHLATAVDDAELAITDVLRGEDHITNTARQLLLCEAMQVAPPRFAHLPIVVGDDGARLSGRSGARGISALRADGWLPDAIVDWLARSACPPITALPASPPAGVAAAFDPAHLGHGTTHLDPELLARLGRDHVGRLSDSDRTAWALQRLGRDFDAADIAALAPGLDSAANLVEAEALVRAVLVRPAAIGAGDGERAAASALIDVRGGYPDRIDVDDAAAMIAALSVGKRSIRRVLTAADHGIPLPLVLAALPRDEVLARAQAVLAPA